MNIPPTAWEPKRPLRRETNCPFVDTISHSFFFNTQFTLSKLFQVMLSLREALSGLKLANRGQKRVDKLLQTNLGFGCCTREEPIQSWQEAEIQYKSYHQRDEIRRLLDRLDSAEAAYYQLRHQRCIARETFPSIKEKFNTLVADYY